MGRRALCIAAWGWLPLVGCQERAEPPPPAASTVAPGAQTAAAPPAPSASAPPAASGSVEPANPPRPKKEQEKSVRPGADAGPKLDKTDRAAAHKRIKGCCAALAEESKKGGGTAKRYEIASAICNQIAERVKSGQANESAAKTLIQSQILGLKVPGGC